GEARERHPGRKGSIRHANSPFAAHRLAFLWLLRALGASHLRPRPRDSRSRMIFDLNVLNYHDLAQVLSNSTHRPAFPGILATSFPTAISAGNRHFGVDAPACKSDDDFASL